MTLNDTAASVSAKGVAAGSGGQAADSSAPMLGIGLTGAGLLLVSGVAVRTRQRAAVRA